MSGLSVLTVQKLLRHHAQTGHDAISNPQSVGFGGESFRHPINHHLNYYQGSLNSWSELYSNVMQSERPLITEFSNYIKYPKGNLDDISSNAGDIQKGVHMLTPAQEISSAKGLTHKYIRPYMVLPKPFDDWETHGKMNYHDKWKGDNFVHSPEEMQQVIKNHISVPTINTGTIIDRRTKKGNPQMFQDYSHVQHLNDFNPKFNHAEALAELSSVFGQEHFKDIKPYSGLITISHTDRRTGDYFSEYVYDPRTEKLELRYSE